MHAYTYVTAKYIVLTLKTKYSIKGEENNYLKKVAQDMSSFPTLVKPVVTHIYSN